MSVIVNTEKMGAIGGVILTMAIVQIVVSAVAYGMTSWNVGAWWAGSLCCVAALCALFSNDRLAVIVGCVLSVMAAIVTFAGIIVDGLSYGQTRALDTCINQYSRGIYGSSKYVDDTAICAAYNSQECICVNGEDATTCYLFGLLTANSCGSILTALPALLLASVIFQILLLAMVLYYSILTCMTLRADSPETPVPPPQVVAAPPTLPIEPTNVV